MTAGDTITLVTDLLAGLRMMRMQVCAVEGLGFLASLELTNVSTLSPFRVVPWFPSTRAFLRLPLAVSPLLPSGLLSGVFPDSGRSTPWEPQILARTSVVGSAQTWSSGRGDTW